MHVFLHARVPNSIYLITMILNTMNSLGLLSSFLFFKCLYFMFLLFFLHFQFLSYIILTFNAVLQLFYFIFATFSHALNLFLFGTISKSVIFNFNLQISYLYSSSPSISITAFCSSFWFFLMLFRSCFNCLLTFL